MSGKYKVISTFSGIGGSSQGYKQAGFEVLASVEFLDYQAANYRLNHPNTKVYETDIRTLSPEQVLKDLNLKPRELDILDGSPPCSSFSIAGKREKGWGEIKAYGNKKQRTDDLFFEYIRFLKYIQPKVFVAENVKGLTMGTAKGYFNEIFQDLKDCGYTVKAKVMNACNYSVPQSRERTIFIGVRNDLGINPSYPEKHDKIITVKEVLPHITHIKHSGEKNNWRESNSVNPTIVQSLISPTGYFSGGQYIKSNNKERIYTIDEIKIIASFPKDYKLDGDFKSQWEGIGRSVPPKMMQAIAENIKENILDKL